MIAINYKGCKAYKSVVLPMPEVSQSPIDGG